MTVTKGKQNYSFPVNSAQNSDVESLHLGSASASDAESLNNEPVHTTRPFVPPVLRGAKFEEHLSLKKNSGRKKLRRYQNRYSLQTLSEEDDEGSLIVIMEPYKSPFSKLLEDKDALQFWNTFIEKSEEEQAEVIKAFSHRNQADLKNDTAKDKPFSRISSKIKRTFKIKRNLSLEQVKKSEDDLIEFFKKTPEKIYIKCPPTYFERLLLHAIAQYHGLQSLGMVEQGFKRIEVCNTLKGWVPAECFLTDFVAQLRK